MTMISVVLPVFKVQAYLAQCLDSVLNQAFRDIEVIAVDDASPDRSGEILAGYAARDSRVKVVTLAENAGLGRARNAGLDAATGDYVWFVDSDDWLALDALGAVARRLRETEADVLVTGFDRRHWNGRIEPGSGMETLAEAPETFTLESWPRIIKVLHVAWNKIVRRDLLVKLGFRFEPGWYEDISFTFPVLAAAGRISTLPRVCVHYRQRRTGAITRTVDDRHFAIFDHWEHAYALIDKYTDRAAALRPELFRRMIWHYLLVLRNPERVRPGARKAFFARMHEHYRRYAPSGGYDEPEGGQGVRHRLVGRGAYRAYQVWDLSGRFRTAAQQTLRRGERLGRRVARRGKRVVYGLYYRMQLRRPVDPSLALFAAYWYRGALCNPAAIAAKAAELVPGLRTVWVVNRSRAGDLPPGTDHVIAGTLAYYRAVARARWLVNNVNWPQQIVKRPEATHVMTHHGTPLKMMGLDQVDRPLGAMSTDFAAQMRRVDRWDYSISANPFTTVAWERAYPARYEHLEVGYPRNDRLAVATAEDAAAVREKLGIRPDQTVVLYAPTHREWLPAGTQVLDVDDLAEHLGPDAVLLVRAHYFYVAAGAAADRVGRVRDVSAYPVVEDLYLAADVLITDYSSAMFDYAVLDRPIVIFASDWPAYRELRGVYFDLLAEPPGAVATTQAELAEIMRDGRYRDFAVERAAFRKRFCALEDGRAAERVVRRVMLGQ
ncbi:MAG TPA: bifunctional glycosyltransferase family 2 protein/CDP-glycerol:glycerophosphate glycerophosphotransferase [Actinoplanes sp.]|nr:bifunctional glycosyltransferase family 2 protein/CDP-glycerol:glycerophosphate glycerophosphotransferase [Actinoplanes sp.]